MIETLANLPDMQVHFGIAPLAIAGGAALLKGLGSWFSGKSKQKKQDAADKENLRAAKAQHGQNETARTAGLRSIISSLAGRGVNLNIDPALLQEREFTGADPSLANQAGRGSALLGGLFGGVGDLGMSYAQSEMQDDVLSPGQPTSNEDIDKLVEELLARKQRGTPLGA